MPMKKQVMMPKKFGIGGDVGRYLGGLGGDWLAGLFGFKKGGKVRKAKAKGKKK